MPVVNVKERNRRPKPGYLLVSLSLLATVGILIWVVGNKSSTDFILEGKITPLSSSPLLLASSPSRTTASETDNEDYSLASKHSYGFFNDVSIKEWKRIQMNVKAMQPNKCPSCAGGYGPGAWFQNNYEPEISCRHEQRIGKLGDGGKWVCDPHRIAEKQDCLVYSVGSSGDFSFEEHVFSKIGRHCEIHTFDPGNYGGIAERVRNPRNMNLQYHQWGIAGKSQGTEYLTVNETVHRLGHVGRTVDIFKIDCEGCELTSFNTWVGLPDSTIRLMQVLVEVHSFTKTRIDHGTDQFFEGMNKHGYAIFHKEPNIQWWTDGPASAIEFSFIKLAPEFYA
ncbi:hypothetical protein ACA910_013380 [Epithemia clementina (nom. ined.)]